MSYLYVPIWDIINTSNTFNWQNKSQRLVPKKKMHNLRLVFIGIRWPISQNDIVIGSNIKNMGLIKGYIIHEIT